MNSNHFHQLHSYRHVTLYTLNLLTVLFVTVHLQNSPNFKNSLQGDIDYVQ